MKRGRVLFSNKDGFLSCVEGEYIHSGPGSHVTESKSKTIVQDEQFVVTGYKEAAQWRREVRLEGDWLSTAKSIN